MSPHPYTEDQLVEQPAVRLFAELGWQTTSALEVAFGAGSSLGHESRGEVVLLPRLRAVLAKFNPSLPPEAIDADERAALKQVARDLLHRVRQMLVLDWRRKSTARSQIRLAIEDVLDAGLPRAYTPELYQAKCDAVFEHVYEQGERLAGIV